MRTLILVVVICWLASPPRPVFGEDEIGVRPLVKSERADPRSVLPQDTLLLDDPVSIEQFLGSLDHEPPDWRRVYGPDGSGHGERLFALNRERDRTRPTEGPMTLLTFLWSGELSRYDPRSGGFSVAVGPKVVETRWGLVRFKPDRLPSNLVAVPLPSLRKTLRERVGRGERIAIDVVMTGRLVAEESVIYDFAHEEPGRGMVMPVVRIERLDYVMFP
jgi:hypothetical protein